MIAGLTVAAILWKYPLSRIVEEAVHGDALAMLPAAIGALFVIWFTSTTSDYLVLRTVVPDLRYKDLLFGKAGVSVLNALGPALNYGGHALWIHRRFGARPAAAGGVVLHITLGDLVAVSIWASAALWLGDDIPTKTRDQLGVAVPIVLAIALTGLMLKPRSQRPILTPWRELPRLHRAGILVVRCCSIGVLVTSTWLAANAFGIEVPFGAVASYLPILLTVAALPINVAGMGPVQAAWVAAFSGYAEPPTILAFQFLWHAMMLGALLLRGAPFLRSAVADVTGRG